ncbi:MAG TPA: TetR/AcrR family transcriptional regulator [Prolixibacteraceae bacterium]|nr:TetR/AcrR family transcriptional regulator [Bacteroidales bacterium]HUM89030.1 TetR/AcrR family transcriptional regulator [Prolixibacteraceae bacterium]
MPFKNKKYISKALQIFKQEGLKLSLDELADRMSVSKKTLYNHFNSKEELHTACMQSMFSELNQKVEILTDDSKNAIECMREGFKGLETVLFQLSPLFINDMQRLYPDIVYSSHSSDVDFFKKRIRENIEKGILEGVYTPDIDVAFFSQYISYSVFGFYFHSVVISTDFSSSTYFNTVLEFTLKGLVSEKGRLLL